MHDSCSGFAEALFWKHDRDIHEWIIFVKLFFLTFRSNKFRRNYSCIYAWIIYRQSILQKFSLNTFRIVHAISICPCILFWKSTFQTFTFDTFSKCYWTYPRSYDEERFVWHVAFVNVEEWCLSWIISRNRLFRNWV